MSVETDVFTAVTGDSGVNALIGTRMYPNILPDETSMPAIVYQQISETVLGGVCYETRLQLRLLATSYSGLKGLRDAVRTLVESKLNWVWISGPDGREENEGFHYQLVDLIIY